MDMLTQFVADYGALAQFVLVPILGGVWKLNKTMTHLLLQIEAAQKRLTDLEHLMLMTGTSSKD